MRIEKYVNQHYDELNQTEKEIASFVMMHPKETIAMSITELAQACLVSRSAIFRFTKKIGLSGFNRLKYILEDDQMNKESQRDEDYLEDAINAIGAAARQFKNKDVERIYASFDKAKNIYICSTGWVQEIVSNQLQRDFFIVGKNAYVLPGAVDELGVVLEKMNAGDVLIIISFNGENERLVEQVRQAQIRGIVTLSFTSVSQNKLAETAQYSLYYNVIDKQVPSPNRNESFFTGSYVLNDLLTMGYADYRKHQELEEQDGKGKKEEQS